MLSMVGLSPNLSSSLTPSSALSCSPVPRDPHPGSLALYLRHLKVCAGVISAASTLISHQQHPEIRGRERADTFWRWAPGHTYALQIFSPILRVAFSLCRLFPFLQKLFSLLSSHLSIFSLGFFFFFLLVLLVSEP